MKAIRVFAGALALLLVPIGAWIAPGSGQGPTQPLSPSPPATAKSISNSAPKPVPSKPSAAAVQESSTSFPQAAGLERDRAPDLAYGAFQRGYYLTAFALATRRVEEKNDIKAMTLLAELYANGYGVERNDRKAAEWYRLAADRGDRDAMFALALFYLGGRTGAPDGEKGAKLLAAAAKLGHIGASYDLALLYLEGRVFPQDFTRAAELFRAAADAGNAEAQYALATLYKEGRGVEKDLTKAARLLAAAAAADNTDAELEYAIALFNGIGIPRDQTTAASLLSKAAQKGNPVAQNRLANILAVGHGVKADPVAAIKWHVVAKAGGVSDIPLDTFVQNQSPEVRAAAEKAAKPWLDAIKEKRGSRS
jgi:uncharacterized protein